MGGGATRVWPVRWEGHLWEGEESCSRDTYRVFGVHGKESVVGWCESALTATPFE